MRQGPILRSLHTDQRLVRRGLCGLHGRGGLNDNTVRKVGLTWKSHIHLSSSNLSWTQSLEASQYIVYHGIQGGIITSSGQHGLRSMTVVIGRLSVSSKSDEISCKVLFHVFAVICTLASPQRSRGLATIVTEQEENSQRRKRRADLSTILY
jgi:hypothetical protein